MSPAVNVKVVDAVCNTLLDVAKSIKRLETFVPQPESPVAGTVRETPATVTVVLKWPPYLPNE